MRKFIEWSLVFFFGWLAAWYFMPNDQEPNQQRLIAAQPPDEIVSLANDVNTDKLATISKPNDTSLQLLQNKQYYEFLQRYENLTNETDSYIYKKHFFRHINELIHIKRFSKALELTTAFIEYEYNDVAALELHAKLHILQKNYLAAIDTIYKAKSYAHEQNKIDQLTENIRSMTSEYSAKLKTHQDHLALLELYQHLINLEPDYSSHYVNLAETYLALDNTQDAKQVLSLIAYDQQASKQVERLITYIQQSPAIRLENTVPVKLLQSGSHFLAQALINQSDSITLMLDTGASLTVIKPETLANMGININTAEHYGWFNTAGGVVRAPIVRLDSLSIAGQEVLDIHVAVMDINSSNPIDGLLGMNYLKHFKFYIDQNASVLHLSSKATPN